MSINDKLIKHAIKDYNYVKHNIKNRNNIINNSNNGNLNNKLLRSLLGIIIYYDNNDKKLNIKFRYDKTNKNMDNRIISYKNGYKKWFLYATQNNHKIKTGIFYLYISDVYYYENDKLPFGVMAKPENKGGLLIPENSLFSYQVENKEYNHEELSNLFEQKCNKTFDNRKQIIFFKGANTGADKWNIRKYLEDILKLNEKFDISLTGARVPNYEYCNYAILLNLPGHQPWSYRFREILLSCSLVVDVSVNVSYDKGKTWNNQWIHFWNCLFIPNKHYIKIDTKFIENDDIFNKNEKEKLKEKLIHLIDDFRINNEKYKKIAIEGCTLMRSIKMKHVYQYMTDLWNLTNYKQV